MDTHSFIEAKITEKTILLIGKSCDPLTKQVEKYINDVGIGISRPNLFETLYIDGRQDVSVIDTYIYQKWLTKCRTVRIFPIFLNRFLPLGPSSLYKRSIYRRRHGLNLANSKRYTGTHTEFPNQSKEGQKTVRLIYYSNLFNNRTTPYIYIYTILLNFLILCSGQNSGNLPTPSGIELGIYL